jgi:lipoprotein signal peptidase
MARSLAVLAVTAAVVASADLAHKATVVAERGGAVLAHERSLLYVVGVAVASLLWASAIALTRSASIAFGGGVLAGGAASNLASLALWPSVPGVPNPLVADGYAFNVADLAVAAGLLVVVAATAAFAARNRGRLGEPVRIRA